VGGVADRVIRRGTARVGQPDEPVTVGDPDRVQTLARGIGRVSSTTEEPFAVGRPTAAADDHPEVRVRELHHGVARPVDVERRGGDRVIRLEEDVDEPSPVGRHRHEVLDLTDLVLGARTEVERVDRDVGPRSSVEDDGPVGPLRSRGCVCRRPLGHRTDGRLLLGRRAGNGYEQPQDQDRQRRLRAHHHVLLGSPSKGA
jgi:hypothetical protein